MSCLHYQQNELYIEKVRLQHIAEQFGTPCYVYSRAAIATQWQAFEEAFSDISHRICYAVKANSNIGILHLLAKLHAHFDIVSAGELERVLAAGGNPKHIVFSGVGKTEAEIMRALQAGIYCFNVESKAELERLTMLVNQHKYLISIALRVNPNVDAHTHSYISTGLKENKFGIASDEVLPLCHYIQSQPRLHLIGIACHIGSQIMKLEPFALALQHLLELYQQIEALGIPLYHVDIGGGLGIQYQHEQSPAISEYAATIKKTILSFFNKKDLMSCPIEIIMEPGRSIVGNAGALLTQVEYLKPTTHKNFAIVDAGMNDLMRPALYHAWQNILPVKQSDAEKKLYDIAGPVCESADFLGKDRELAITAGDILAIDSAGAYGFSMSSNYNSRCRIPEILVDGEQLHLIRRREKIEELFALESIASSK